MLTKRKKGARTLDHYSKITKLYKQMGGRIFFYFHNWACQCRSRHLQMVGISSNECRFRSTRSISRFCSSRASSRIFLTLDILLETGKHWTWLIFLIRLFYAYDFEKNIQDYDKLLRKSVITLTRCVEVGMERDVRNFILLWEARIEIHEWKSHWQLK